MSSPAEALDRPRDVAQVLRVLLELSKPGVTRLVLVTTACGALAAPGRVDFVRLAVALVGTGLVVAGANALNMFLERDSDAFMTRTRGRPLPSGRLRPDDALLFGVGVAVAGLMLLAHFVSMAAVALAALALLSYVLVYTPLKRVTTAALYVGAVPGALPPAIGYAAMTGTLEWTGLFLFLILLVWQLPHFIAISVFRSQEYSNAGLKIVPVQYGLFSAKLHIVAFSLLLLAITLLPVMWGVGGVGYAAIAALSGVAYLAWAIRGFWADPKGSWARSLFLASMPHLVLVMAALVIGTA
jgi:protoheme IX farnesyltransferase